MNKDITPTNAETFIRTARKEHRCNGVHIPGKGTGDCGRGPIARGTVYVEYLGESAAYQSGKRYHVECAISQGIVARSAIVEAEQIVMIDAGDHLLLQLPQPGKCSSCQECHSFFICRGGRTFCAACDERMQREEAARASALMSSLRCRCPWQDPDELFACTCEASQ